jgi:small ligand-binding sensory domain FIST
VIAPGTATYGAAASEHPDPAHAVAEAAGAVLDRVGPAPDVAFVFVSTRHGDAIDDIAAACRAILRPGVLMGATAAGVIAGPVEMEDVPAVAVWAGRTGRAEAARLEAVRTPDGTAVMGLPDAAAVGRRTLVLLADPHTFPTEALVRAVNDRHPDLAVVGGLASAGPGANRLVLDGEVHHDGAVAVLLPEGIGEISVVAQGCRPVGEPFIVTAADGDEVLELGSRPALDRLRELLGSADDDERELLTRGLHVGLVIDESAAAFGRGDFLVRAVLDADPERGALRIGDRVAVGTTLQFHVRDAVTADEDLRDRLQGVDADTALVFTCNGRGHRLFGEPDHDAALVSEAVHAQAVAGMFCAGEIGPVGGRNHLHGFTASTLLLYG